MYAGKDISKYEKIAPSVVFDLDDGTWRDQIKKIGKLVAREQQAETFIKDYQAQTERVKTLINNKLGKDATVMAVRITAKELDVISQEVLPDYDADAIFVIVNREDAAEKLFKQIADNPIWQGLKAVKSKNVYMIPDQPWLDYSAF